MPVSVCNNVGRLERGAGDLLGILGQSSDDLLVVFDPVRVSTGVVTAPRSKLVERRDGHLVSRAVDSGVNGNDLLKHANRLVGVAVLVINVNELDLGLLKKILVVLW